MTSGNMFQPKPTASSASGGGREGSLFPTASRSVAEQTSATTEPKKFNDVTSKYTAQCSLNTPQAASLVLIDRTQDLYTPSTHTGEASKELHTSPLAHRILCTLSKGPGSSDSTLYDVSAMAPFSVPSSSSTLPFSTSSSTSRSSSSSSSGASSSGSSTNGVHGGTSDMDALCSPFPAISTLPLQLPMSLCLSLNDLQKTTSKNTTTGQGSSMPVSVSGSGSGLALESDVLHSDDDLLLLRQALFARSEDEGRTLLCAALTRRIKQFKGTVPPSKKGRGLGAEVFALVQALSTAPGTAGDTLGTWLDRKERELHGSTSVPVPVPVLDSVSNADSKSLSVPVLKDSNTIGFNPCTCLSTQVRCLVCLLICV